MLLVTHICIAVSSLLVSVGLLIRPSVWLQMISWAVITATLITGVILVFTTRSHIVESCIMGLMLISVTVVCNLKVRHQLAEQTRTHG